MSKLLRERYVTDERKPALECARVNAQVARLIRDMRVEAGLTQAELAALVGTTQSVISRMEDSDYEGHSLSLLCRIASALDQGISVCRDRGGDR